MGCCGTASIVNFEVDIGKRDTFIKDFFNKKFNYEDDQRTSTFIKSQKKKMKISKNSIYIEQDLIVTIKTDNPNTYSDCFWFLLDENVNELKSKQIFVDDQKVDDTKFEIDGKNIKIEYKDMYNGEIRKIKIIQEIEKSLINYQFQKLLLNDKNIPVQFLIYTEDNIKIDDVTNENYKFNKELNLAYFEGKTTNETALGHGYIYYSKIVNFQIYKFIPEYIKKEDEIITTKQNSSGARVINVLAIYKKVIITDEGQDIDELFKFKLTNYDPGTFSTDISHGLMKNTKFEVNLVELNGKKADYTEGDSTITINNVGIFNNQFGEIHVKYKYFTNEEKNIVRQESIITSNAKDTYCKLILKIPDKYVYLSNKDIFQKDPKNNGIYFLTVYQKMKKYLNYSNCL